MNRLFTKSFFQFLIGFTAMVLLGTTLVFMVGLWTLDNTDAGSIEETAAPNTFE